MSERASESSNTGRTRMLSPSDSMSWRRRGGYAAGLTVVSFFALVYLVPFVVALATAFKTRPDAAAHPLGLWPDPFDGRAWGVILADEVLRWTFNSVVVTVCVTVGRIFLDSLAGYALARLRWPGRTLVFGLVVGALTVPPIVLAIPRFLVLKQFGLIDSYLALILPLAVDAFGIFLMRQFFLAVPKEMEEAARVDGAGILRTYWSVILPLARPGLVTLTILSFQASWNEFLHPLVAVPGEPSLRTLPVGLAQLRGQLGEGLDFPVLLGGSVLVTLPVAVVFLFFQRHFVRGVASSGVKE